VTSPFTRCRSLSDQHAIASFKRKFLCRPTSAVHQYGSGDPLVESKRPMPDELLVMDRAGLLAS